MENNVDLVEDGSKKIKILGFVLLVLVVGVIVFFSVRFFVGNNSVTDLGNNSIAKQDNISVFSNMSWCMDEGFFEYEDFFGEGAKSLMVLRWVRFRGQSVCDLRDIDSDKEYYLMQNGTIYEVSFEESVWRVNLMI